jgi:hypothetical protein
VRFQVLTAASMMFRIIFWDVLPCKRLSTDVSEVRASSIIRAMVMDAARTSETSVDNYFIRQYIPEDKCEKGYCVYKERPLMHILSQMNPLYTLSIYFFKINFNIILKSKNKTLKRIFSFKFSKYIFY